MPETLGLNHLGLTVEDLETSTAFFVSCLGWSETARDPSYPRTTITDGELRLTLWQQDRSGKLVRFNRRQNVGLHHLALQVASKEDLVRLADKLAAWPGVEIEFMPELMGTGPRMHMMFTEPGGIRLELLWMGT